jgi:hypothetical protein
MDNRTPSVPQHISHQLAALGPLQAMEHGTKPLMMTGQIANHNPMMAVGLT